MRNNIISRLVHVVFVAVAPFAASGQNLNPTVEVSKTYEGKLLEVDKPQLRMAVPDSVYRFNLDFDYSVAATPYKGSYEFSPYSVDMAPAPTARKVNSLYLKAGIGYQLHPVVDFVWSPTFRIPLRMNVYASHSSFVGNYWKMHMYPAGENTFRISKAAKNHRGGNGWFGHDFRTRAGAEARYDWENLLARLDVAYEGLQQEDLNSADRFYNGLDVRAAVESKRSGEGVLGYKVNAAYRFGRDVSSLKGSKLQVKENDVEVDAVVSYGLEGGHAGIVDLGFDMAGTDGALVSGGVDFDLAPHYLFEYERWKFDLGVRLSSVFKTNSASECYGFTEQAFYPDVRIEFKVVEGLMKAYFDFDGDSRIVSYSDLIRFNGRADMNYGLGVWNILDVVDEPLNASLGLEGRIGPRFSYDLRGGYANVANTPLDGLYRDGDTLLPGIGYGRYEKYYVTLDWLWDIRNVRFDGSLEYTNTFNTLIKDRRGLFLPSALRGDVSVSYNWKKRINVSLDCEFATSRKGTMLNDGLFDLSFSNATIPGYADLGLNAEYAVNRKLSAWLRGGNLLAMTIQRSLLYAEKGPYFTAGIYLNL